MGSDAKINVSKSASSLHGRHSRYAVVRHALSAHTWHMGLILTRFLQRERSEQLRSLSMVAGVMDGFAMSSLLQLNYSASPDAMVPYDSPASCGYALTLGITVRPAIPPCRKQHVARMVLYRQVKLPCCVQLPLAKVQSCCVTAEGLKLCPHAGQYGAPLSPRVSAAAQTFVTSLTSS